MKRHTSCLICASKPSLLFCKIPILNCNATCGPPSRSKFTVSRTLQRLNFLCNCILTAAVITDVAEIYQDLRPEHLFTFMKVSINVCVVYCNSCYIYVIKHKVREYNGLLTIINHELLSGLEGKFAQIQSKMHKVTAALTLLELLNLCFLFGPSSESWLSVLASEISMYGLVSAMVYFVQDSRIYTALLETCFREVELVLRTYNGAAILETLETVQRTYMAMRSNFGLSALFLSPSVIVFYVANTVLLIICQTYIVFLYGRGNIRFQTNDCQTFIKSLMVIWGQVFFCLESQKLNGLVEKPLSFLLKFPLSRLQPTEAAKVESLIRIMSASELSRIGSNLIVSIGATGLTYVLVALQFRLFW